METLPLGLGPPAPRRCVRTRSFMGHGNPRPWPSTAGTTRCVRISVLKGDGNPGSNASSQRTTFAIRNTQHVNAWGHERGIKAAERILFDAN